MNRDEGLTCFVCVRHRVQSHVVKLTAGVLVQQRAELENKKKEHFNLENV